MERNIVANVMGKGLVRIVGLKRQITHDEIEVCRIADQIAGLGFQQYLATRAITIPLDEQIIDYQI